MNQCKANYGMNAPNVVRNLFLLSLGSFGLAILSFQIQSVWWFWKVHVWNIQSQIILIALLLQL
jgi:hypothetical protein